MIKLKVFVFTVCIMLLGVAKVSAQEEEAMDTIYKVEGKVMPVDVVNLSQGYVSFKIPGNDETYTIERKEVQKIVYRTGRIDEFNKPIFQMIDDYSWEAVWLTEDKKDIKELYKRGEVSAQSPASSRSPKAAKKSAIIRLQKKAAAMKGTVIYITKKQNTGGYGEYPGYYIEGVVYGDQPLKEGESEGSDKDSDMKRNAVM